MKAKKLPPSSDEPCDGVRVWGRRAGVDGLSNRKGWLLLPLIGPPPTPARLAPASLPPPAVPAPLSSCLSASMCTTSFFLCATGEAVDGRFRRLLLDRPLRRPLLPLRDALREEAAGERSPLSLPCCSSSSASNSPLRVRSFSASAFSFSLSASFSSFIAVCCPCLLAFDRRRALPSSAARLELARLDVGRAMRRRARDCCADEEEAAEGEGVGEEAADEKMGMSSDMSAPCRWRRARAEEAEDGAAVGELAAERVYAGISYPQTNERVEGRREKGTRRVRK